MPDASFPGIETHHRSAHYAVLDSGAHVLAWTPPGHNPVLWVSPLASFEPGVAVRGGIPVVFPWFGPAGDGRGSHGFARTAAWQRSSVENDPAAGRLVVRHRLDGAPFGIGEVSAELVSAFSPDRLEVTLTVHNAGPTPFRYEAALHTYLAVSDVVAVAVDGLDGCAYHDKVTGVDAVQAGPVRFAGEVDRVYEHAGEATVADPGWSRSIVVGKAGSASTVVWNPGDLRGKAMGDVGEHWPRFVCVEAGNVGVSALELAAGEAHSLTQWLRLS